MIYGEAKVVHNSSVVIEACESCWGVRGDPYRRPAQKEQRVTAHIVGKRRFLQAPPMSLIGRPPLV